ncbi:hypothetical protein CROQUDRAFT_686041 [Cronartium quercuum f. sp. fusiforme G11]|uniref:Uncharacterized protein n=1 Tax=Cronartium quercuum f. sp. fusiforme G11 TaxID=708437 RepID=A0A9P6N7J5_9BASI|nr:hypothetical protein CROQUDRAFT_686041 [Cronartium quercuum f. sp. fusiforme G11]
MKDWIQWFLSLGEVEEAIEDWAQKVKNSPADEVADYQQSVAWKLLYPRSSSARSSKGTPPPLELAFSLFINWFNPLGNKISGWQVSIGVIALNCMNLPPHIHHQAQNNFLSGVVPAPRQPDMTTINHILTPLVDKLIKLDRGFSVLTKKYPQGRKVTVQLACLIGNIMAMHKHCQDIFAGFTSHSGTHFCTWCDFSKDDRWKMVIGRLQV